MENSTGEVAQNYALANRRVMMETAISALRCHIPTEFTLAQEAINCHHNYVEVDLVEVVPILKAVLGVVTSGCN